MHFSTSRVAGRYLDHDRDKICCPIVSGNTETQATIAAHAYCCFSSRTGHNGSGIRFDKGYYVGFPRISSTASPSEIKAWNDNDPKGYQIPVLEPNVKETTFSLRLTRIKDGKNWMAKPCNLKATLDRGLGINISTFV